MFTAVVLLCAIALQSCDGSKALGGECVPGLEVVHFVPADHLSVSDRVNIEVCVGQKLAISPRGLDGYGVCYWLHGTETVTSVSGNVSAVLRPLSEADSGNYTVSCGTGSETESLLSVALHVVIVERPTRPQLTLMLPKNRAMLSPEFACVSGGSPKPTILWSGDVSATTQSAENGKVKSKIPSAKYAEKGVMCCATNAEGQECSQLYDYDLAKPAMNRDAENLTLSPGQSLLLRCRMKREIGAWVVWEKDGKIMNDSSYECPSKISEKTCICNDTYRFSLMAYLFIGSVSGNHSGAYTCRNSENQRKTYVRVQAEDFLSAHLDDSKTVLSEQTSHDCLQASVSHHRALQRCTWEAPDGNMTKCSRESWVTKQRTVKLCAPLKTGEYKLHLKAGGLNVTKSISVCVMDEPKFKFIHDTINNTFNIETSSAVPANYSWMFCSSTNGSCEANWEEIPGASAADSDVQCNKTIKSSLSRETLDGFYLKFCLTNSIKSWCKVEFPVYLPSPQHSTANRKSPHDGSFMLLKVGSILLVMALVVVSVLLTYFIKKKKPQYQPQLQMIQMVGPNDNDYIYINFKDFEYERKWEFPRENLELGKELGSGAFGMVLQATAYGINRPGVVQQVAVKMLKDKHQTVEKEALMSELKMLTHIGHHDNIVNLLGACTDTGPIYLIFQYCCHGDLLNYLKHNSERYHKSVTDAFTKDRFSSIYQNLQTRKSSSETRVDSYVAMYPAATRGREDIALLTLNLSDMDSSEDPEIFEDPDDQMEDLQALTFDDLLSFAFQVAKGMEFLSAKNCIHRDLAARNVLVTKGRMVKIGDFGLARDIDNDSNYVVRGNVRLPVKWMAPESIFQGMYTMKSDVWAYGILLWEIFSLGVTPYPGMKVDHTFYSMIERGFKMERPYYADECV